MAGARRYHAAISAQAWLRHQAGMLLATDRVPKRLSAPLFIPDTDLLAGWVLRRLVMVLDLWREYYKPLTVGQAAAYHLCTHVEICELLSSKEHRYIGKACASGDTVLIGNITRELLLTGQVIVPPKDHRDEQVQVASSTDEARAI